MENTKTLTDKQINDLDPKTVSISLCLGGEDVLTERGDELIERFEEDGLSKGEKATLANAIKWNLSEVSGNSFTVVFIHDGVLKEMNFI